MADAYEFDGTGTPEDMQRTTDLLFNPSYWEERADGLRNQAAALREEPRFYGVLMRQAEEFDKLAQRATKLRQQRSMFNRISPSMRPSLGVVPIKPALRPTGTDGD